MPEIPKWLIVVIAITACWWIITQSVEFIGKVNTTVDKANSSINQSQNSLQSVEKYE